MTAPSISGLMTWLGRWCLALPMRTIWQASAQTCRVLRDCVKTSCSADPLDGRLIMRKLFAVGLACVVLSVSLAALAQEAYTTRTVNVRAGPDLSYPVVAGLGGGAPVQVFGCLDDWSWCDV